MGVKVCEQLSRLLVPLCIWTRNVRYRVLRAITVGNDWNVYILSPRAIRKIGVGKADAALCIVWCIIYIPVSNGIMEVTRSVED